MLRYVICKNSQKKKHRKALVTFIAINIFLQDKASGLNALTIYILICMMFIVFAMMYYGLVLFKLRKILKIEDSTGVSSKMTDIQMNNSIIRWDHFMFFIFVIFFFLFNFCYFTKYVFTTYVIN